MWFSVPSVAMFMSGYRMLKPDSFPSLRYSLFCGEPLSATLADEWQKAAPNSILENLYGPTEATIAISRYRWDSNTSPEECENGIVPIGWIFDKQRSTIIDPEQKPVPSGSTGELCLSGSQVTQGYLNNPEKTRSQYIKISELGEDTWYRTGDLAKQDERGCLYYFGRIDNQVKILGHRVELDEVDAALREAYGSEMAVSIAWPIKDGTATGIVAFVHGDQKPDESQIQEHCRKILPSYMVPKRIYFIDKLPLNANGKIDRLRLIEMLDETKGRL
jgi:acyl-coenzyme A synthetase/AMP-(fatty) acid ligase